MAILNRRNALLGWIAWQAGKRVAKSKAKAAIPGSGGSGRPWKRLLVGLAAATGALWFWRRRTPERQLQAEMDAALAGSAADAEAPPPASGPPEGA